MVYRVSTDQSQLDFEFIFEFISNSYWAAGIPAEVLRKAIQHSLCFGLFANDRQIGFARLITDRATFAYLADVFVDPAHRGKGLASKLMDAVMQHPETQGLRKIMLTTSDAQGLYAKYSFSEVGAASGLMQLHNPNVYRPSENA